MSGARSLPTIPWLPLPPTLAPRDEGELVRQLQMALAQGGWYQGAIDGRFGANTTQAVQAFQQQRNLPDHGIVDSTTWQHLLISLEPQGIWATIPFPTAEMITFTPLLVAQPTPPPSPLWLLLMALIPLMGGGLTYLQHRWQGRKPQG
jgi:peptidoglycan hydrolase-like protein with peptidoglycan-binding domain